MRVSFDFSEHYRVFGVSHFIFRVPDAEMLEYLEALPQVDISA